MDRCIPQGSKICAEREQKRRHEMHRERIRKCKALVDTSEPAASQLDHVRNNLKKEQMLEERYSEIDRENRILLTKMSDIVRKPQHRSPRDGAGGETRSLGPLSLNRDARKKELLRITRDNQSILMRIQQAQPAYNHVELEGSHRRNENYLKNCSEYPLVLRSARKAYNISSELVPLTEGVSQDISRPDSAQRLVSAAAQRGGALSARESRKERTFSGSLPARQQSIEAGASVAEVDRRYVLKESRSLGGSLFLIEMSTDGRTLSISAYGGEAQTTLELVVKEKIHRRLYRETNGDYGLLAARLRLEGGGPGGGPLSLSLDAEPASLSKSAAEDAPASGAAAAASIRAAVAPAVPEAVARTSSITTPRAQFGTPRVGTFGNEDIDADTMVMSNNPGSTDVAPRVQFGTPRERTITDEGADSDNMVIYHKPGSAGSINAEIDLNSSGDFIFRMRGLTPSDGQATPRHGSR